MRTRAQGSCRGRRYSYVKSNDEIELYEFLQVKSFQVSAHCASVLSKQDEGLGEACPAHVFSFHFHSSPACACGAPGDARKWLREVGAGCQTALCVPTARRHACCMSGSCGRAWQSRPTAASGGRGLPRYGAPFHFRSGSSCARRRVKDQRTAGAKWVRAAGADTCACRRHACCMLGSCGRAWQSRPTAASGGRGLPRPSIFILFSE